MKREIIVETDDDFEGCDECIHEDDTEEICKMRGCIHAFTENDIKECYQQKGYTISKSMFNACLDAMAKFEKIKKIVSEVEE